MKKRVSLIILALVCMLMLSACGCKHETWIDADCVTPKTCAECGETEGEALGHVWLAATCETPKTCETCGETEGDPMGHSWADATCEDPKTCSGCFLTEGEALGHVWLDATTEAPKTCETCAATEGERIITDSRFTTAATADLQGTWTYDIAATGDMMDLPGFEGTLDMRVVMEFGNDGTMKMSMEMLMDDEFTTAFTDYIIESVYAELAAEGLSRDAADAALKEAYGMTVPEYAAYMVQSMDLTEMMSAAFSSFNIEGVYYVDGDQLYTGLNWNTPLEAKTFELDGDVLILHEDIAQTGAETAEFHRVVSYTP